MEANTYVAHAFPDVVAIQAKEKAALRFNEAHSRPIAYVAVCVVDCE